jgi:hypothetical protein
MLLRWDNDATYDAIMAPYKVRCVLILRGCRSLRAHGRIAARCVQEDEERPGELDPRLDLHVFRPRSQVRGPSLAPAPDGRAMRRSRRRSRVWRSCG